MKFWLAKKIRCTLNLTQFQLEPVGVKLFSQPNNFIIWPQKFEKKSYYESP